MDNKLLKKEVVRLLVGKYNIGIFTANILVNKYKLEITKDNFEDVAKKIFDEYIHRLFV